MNATVSVIIPVFNVEKYITDCINSVLMQTYTDLEVIIIDDGSTDDCPKIIDDYAKEDCRIKVIHQKNAGPSTARNAGLDKATGEYVVFVDSDDVIDGKMIEILVGLALKTSTDIAMCAIKNIDESGKLLEESTTTKEYPVVWSKKFFWENVYEGHPSTVISCSKLYRRRLFNTLRFRDGMIHEDEEILHEVISQVNEISYDNRVLYLYRKRSGSITSKGFSINSLDALEAHIDRTDYFIISKNKNRAILSGLRCKKMFGEAYQKLDMSKLDNSERINELLMKYRNTVQKLLFTFGINAKVIKMCLFCIDAKKYIMLFDGNNKSLSTRK